MKPSFPARVLAIGAHPDDIEIYCAGTLARFIAIGTLVDVATVCRGDRGGAVPPEELALLRREEATAAAKELGATPHFLGLPDGEVSDEPATRDQFLELLRSTRPELILTHGPTDYHDDHVRVGEWVVKAAWQAANPGYSTRSPALRAPVPVFYFDNLAGIAFEPTHYVDITDHFAIKGRMFACHTSQIARSSDGRHRLVEPTEVLARLRGLQCGVRYAEAFRPVFQFGRSRAEPVFP